MNNLIGRKTIKITDVNNSARLDNLQFFLECDKEYEKKN